jgi:hypothetical protein
MSEHSPFDILCGSRIVGVFRDDDVHSPGVVFEIGATADDLVKLERRMLLGDVSAVEVVERLAMTRFCAFPFSADCCSTTWLADVVGLDALLGQEVLEVVSVELPEGHLTDPERTKQESDQVMGWEFRTSKGVTTLAVRNSSNGYYGGSVELGQWGSDAPVDAVKIDEDYSA